MNTENKPEKTPLDYEAPTKREEVLNMHKGYWMVLEFLPIGLLGISLLLHETALPFEKEFLIAGGILAALIYTVYNTLLFYRDIIYFPELAFSGLGAIIFLLGLMAIWVGHAIGINGFQAALNSLYAGIFLTAIAILLFALNLFQFGKFTYYRTLITRNLVFVAVLYRLLMGTF